MTTKMIRKKKAPLPSWSDKVSAAARFLSRQDSYAQDDDYYYAIIQWHCLVNMFGNLVDKVYTSIEARAKHHTKTANGLVDSPMGLFCPRCLTNEFLASENDFRTGSTKLSHPRKYCLICHRTEI